MEDREKENVTSYNVGFKRDKTKYIVVANGDSIVAVISDTSTVLKKGYKIFMPEG